MVGDMYLLFAALHDNSNTDDHDEQQQDHCH